MAYRSWKEGDSVCRRATIRRGRLAAARAFTLIELLMVVITVPIVMVALSGLYRGFLHDVPQMVRLVEENTTVLNIIDQLHRDMGTAVDVPEQAGDRHADASTLLIAEPNAVVCYRFEDGQTVRTLFREEASAPAEEQVWKARDAVIEWQPWRPEGRVCGVEVHSHLKQTVAGKTLRKFRSSYVFFAQGPARGGQVQ